MSQEPWNDEIYDSTENTRKGRAEKGNATNRIFTILAVLFLIIVIAITSLAIYLSSGGSKTDSTQEFYSASSSSSVATSSSSVTQASAPASEPSTTEQSSSSSEAPAEDGATLVVQPGEGEASIAARAGISIADLERLNPDKMSTGSWLAHPGDTVRIK